MMESAENQNMYCYRYTHLQIAMPSSFGCGFQPMRESDWHIPAECSFKIVDQNPLVPLQVMEARSRSTSTKELGFETWNTMPLQHKWVVENRRKFCFDSSVATTLSFLWMFVYESEFWFNTCASLTGSSIMPHKKTRMFLNWIRGKCNKFKRCHTKSFTNNLQVVTTGTYSYWKICPNSKPENLSGYRHFSIKDIKVKDKYPMTKRPTLIYCGH
jgi:argininosuccinate lyase